MRESSDAIQIGPLLTHRARLPDMRFRLFLIGCTALCLAVLLRLSVHVSFHARVLGRYSDRTTTDAPSQTAGHAISALSNRVYCAVPRSPAAALGARVVSCASPRTLFRSDHY